MKITPVLIRVIYKNVLLYLAKIYQFAINGEVKAAKLYFEIIGNNPSSQVPGNTVIENQNNYIQINGTVLSQENIKPLSSEQLNTIESMVKTVLSKTENLTKPDIREGNYI